MAKPKRPTRPSKPVRKVIAQTFVSMDGVMQAPGGPDEDREGGFRHGGWSMTFWDDKMGQVMTEQMSRLDTMLLGRKTYDIFAGYWPKHEEEPGAAPLNEATKLVASRKKKKLGWKKSHVLEGNVASAVKKLKSESGSPLQVIGSGNFLQTLLKNDLVDELHLWVFPVVLGKGKRLFGDGAIPSAWTLKDCTTSTTGVVIQKYERAGEIPYGKPPGT